MFVVTIRALSSARILRPDPRPCRGWQTLGQCLCTKRPRRYQMTFAVDVHADDGQQCAERRAVNVEATSRAAALNQRKNDVAKLARMAVRL